MAEKLRKRMLGSRKPRGGAPRAGKSRKKVLRAKKPAFLSLTVFWWLLTF